MADSVIEQFKTVLKRKLAEQEIGDVSPSFACQLNFSMPSKKALNVATELLSYTIQDNCDAIEDLRAKSEYLFQSLPKEHTKFFENEPKCEINIGAPMPFRAMISSLDNLQSELSTDHDNINVPSIGQDYKAIAFQNDDEMNMVLPVIQSLARMHDSGRIHEHTILITKGHMEYEGGEEVCSLLLIDPVTMEKIVENEKDPKQIQRGF